MIRLVVNADDLGLHPRIDEGILKAHREGIVTSATVLVTGPVAKEAVAAARRQGLALGVHLCLSTALPCAAPALEVSSVAPNGRFRPAWSAVVKDFVTGRIQPDEVRRELEAQVDKAFELGFEPDHLDGHQHLHMLPGIRSMVERLAQKHHLPVRWPREPFRLTNFRTQPGPALKSLGLTLLGLNRPARNVRCVPALGIFEAGQLNEARLLALVDSLSEGDFEIGCHPGAGDVVVPEDPTWSYGWMTELHALCSEQVKKRLAERKIQLCSYRELFAHAPKGDRRAV